MQSPLQADDHLLWHYLQRQSATNNVSHTSQKTYIKKKYEFGLHLVLLSTMLSPQSNEHLALVGTS